MKQHRLFSFMQRARQAVKRQRASTNWSLTLHALLFDYMHQMNRTNG